MTIRSWKSLIFSINTILRLGRPSRPFWDGVITHANGKINKNRTGFYNHWDKLIPREISKKRPSIDRCHTYFNWQPGQYINFKSPDPANLVHPGGIKHPYANGDCWRIHTAAIDKVDYSNQLDGTICTGFMELTNDGVPLNDEFKQFRSEVGKDNIEMYMATKALNNLGNDQLKILQPDGSYKYSEVILTGTFNRLGLMNPLIKQKTMANLIEACKRIYNITHKAVYILKPVPCQARNKLKESIEQAFNNPIEKGLFYNPKLLNNTFKSHHLIEEWDRQWTTSPIQK